MELDDIRVSRAIIRGFYEKLLDNLECDTAIVGGGPAGLTAAYFLAKAGHKVALFERRLAMGGGMWGGGMMFNEIVVQASGRDILAELGIETVAADDDGYYRTDSVLATSTLCSAAAKAGARLFNQISVEDVMITEGSVTGLVLNWTAVQVAKLHVDPLTIRAKFVVDATGHTAEVASVVQRKSGCDLQTETGKVIGEKPMWADVGERMTVENTREVFPGVYVAGMSCNAVFGAPRMGPIFGGMLMSGRKVAEQISARL